MANLYEPESGLDPMGIFENKIWRQMTQGADVREFPGVSYRGLHQTNDSHWWRRILLRSG